MALQPTDEERDRVRAWTAERILAGGNDADTNFTDAEIDRLYDEHGGSLEAVAAEMWATKAGLLLEGRLVDEKQVGSEKLKFMSVKDRHAIYMEMSDYYGSLIGGADALTGSQAAELDPPDVLGTDTKTDKDLSRLIGDPYA